MGLSEIWAKMISFLDLYNWTLNNHKVYYLNLLDFGFKNNKKLIP